MIFPIRINKYLAEKKICSRREGDKLIEDGKVLINGKGAHLGEIVNENDRVEVARNFKELVYIAYNKPAGIVTSCPQKGEKAILDILKLKYKVFPIGRLDKASRGLILLTNDGRITDCLLNPKYYHEKEYIVEVDRKLAENDLKQFRQGITLAGGFITKKCRIKKINDHTFSIILTEGKNRQIRRMCAALKYDVLDLNRIRIMNIKLDSLPEGHYKILSGEKLKELLAKLEIKEY